MPRFWGLKIKFQINCFFSFNETFQQKKVFAKNLGIPEKRDPGPWEEPEPLEDPGPYNDLGSDEDVGPYEDPGP